MRNIKEREEFVHNLFSGYWSGEGGPSISRRIMEEEEEDFGDQNEQDVDEDADLEDDDEIEMEMIGSVGRDPEGSDREVLEQEDFEDSESPAVRRSHRLQYQTSTINEEPMDMDYQRSGTPPPPEEERREPWHFANVEEVCKWREFCREELFKNIRRVEDQPAQENVTSKRGRYKSTTTELDRCLESSSTRRFVEWRRTAADGLSNEALDQLLEILHDPDCNNDLLPRNHYYLEQLQDRALASFKPKTTRWKIPTENSDVESEEIVITDIEHLLRLQLQDPEIARSIITDYSDNNGVIAHPSHGEIWKKLAAYDTAKGSHPLCLKVFI
jgi:hypothetical protein